jgi:ABC-type uncharacterized transport system substrate-binding protein
MKSKPLFWLLLTVLLITAPATAAQQPGKVFRIGFLDSSTASGMAVLIDAFRQELSKLGWVEGTNFVIEYRFGEQKLERLPDLAAELVRSKVDLILVGGTPPALAAKKATTTIPIVIANTSDPLGEGLVASLARPGGNVTGFSALTTELNTKRLEILKDAVPGLTRVGLLRPASGPSLQVDAVTTAAAALRLKLEIIKNEPDAMGIENAFQTAKQKQVGAIMTVTTRRFFTERKRMVETASKYRMPAILFPERVCR